MGIDDRLEAESAGARQVAFRVSVWAFLLFLYLFSPVSSLLLGWFVDFEDNISHRVHEVTFGLLFVIVLVGIAAQLRSPKRHVAGLQQALAMTGVFVAVVTASTGWEWTALIYLIPVVAIAILHPARREVFRLSLRIDRRIGALMLLATIPMLTAFFEEFSKASNEVRGHQAHWGGMAAFTLGVLIVGYLATTRPPGWSVSAWSVAGSAIVFGSASVAFRFDASARPDARAALIIIWGVLMALATAKARALENPVVATEPIGLDPDAKSKLRRRSKGRLLGGVAKGISTKYDWNVWVIRGILVILSVPTLLGPTPLAILPIAYATAWWRIPLDTGTLLEAGSSKFASIRGRMRQQDRSSWARRLLGAAGAVGIIFVGGLLFEVADSFEAPPVPHDIETTAQSSCVVCHATGAEHAPIIDPFTHNFYSDFVARRSFIPFCGECHDLPLVSTLPTFGDARGFGHGPGVVPLGPAALVEIAAFAADMTEVGRE